MQVQNVIDMPANDKLSLLEASRSAVLHLMSQATPARAHCALLSSQVSSQSQEMMGLDVTMSFVGVQVMTSSRALCFAEFPSVFSEPGNDGIGMLK